MTWDDRYPEVFSSVAAILAERTEPKILSFGCSTGEELFALRNYAPGARLVGAEINSASRSIAKNRADGDPNISVTGSDWQELERLCPFDAVFAMSVLCHWPEPRFRSFARTYPFSAWAETVSRLGSLVEPDGLLVLANSSYLFEEHPLFTDYEPVEHAWSASLDVVARHWRDGGSCPAGRSNQSVIYRRLA